MGARVIYTHHTRTRTRTHTHTHTHTTHTHTTHTTYPNLSPFPPPSSSPPRTTTLGPAPTAMCVHVSHTLTYMRHVCHVSHTCAVHRITYKGDTLIHTYTHLHTLTHVSQTCAMHRGRESVLFIGTRFSNLYTAVRTH